VEQLIGPQTVSTMPPDTVEAFLDHGHVADTLESDLEAAHRTFDRFADVGIDYDDLTATLEREGVDKFAASFQELLDGVRDRSEQLKHVDML
jgi:transaldolase